MQTKSRDQQSFSAYMPYTTVSFYSSNDQEAGKMLIKPYRGALIRINRSRRGKPGVAVEKEITSRFLLNMSRNEKAISFYLLNGELNAQRIISK